MSGTAGWITLLGLGAFHGINPAMGWLFAVALGLQEQDRRAVWRALLPLAVGHGLAILAAVAVAAAIALVVPLQYLRWLVAAVLVFVGVRRLIRHRHPRFGGMRVSLVDLAVWSFLMASAHGAGLMVVPLVLGDDARLTHVSEQARATHEPLAGIAAPHGSEHAEPAAPPARAGMPHGHPGGLFATAVHTGGYLVVTALVALLVFERFGLGLLRRAWVNLDLVWAGALIATGGLTLLL